jgi:hypothetical protein
LPMPELAPVTTATLDSPMRFDPFTSGPGNE